MGWVDLRNWCQCFGLWWFTCMRYVSLYSLIQSLFVMIRSVEKTQRYHPTHPQTSPCLHMSPFCFNPIPKRNTETLSHRSTVRPCVLDTTRAGRAAKTSAGGRDAVEHGMCWTVMRNMFIGNISRESREYVQGAIFRIFWVSIYFIVFLLPIQWGVVWSYEQSFVTN